jgi:hypothetical protein
MNIFIFIFMNNSQLYAVILLLQIERQNAMSVSCNIITKQKAEISSPDQGRCTSDAQKEVFFTPNIYTLQVNITH